MDAWRHRAVERHEEAVGYFLRQRTRILDGRQGVPWYQAHSAESRIVSRANAANAWHARASLGPDLLFASDDEDRVRGTSFLCALAARDESGVASLLQGIQELPDELSLEALQALTHVPNGAVTPALMQFAMDYTPQGGAGRSEASHHRRDLACAAIRAVIDRGEALLSERLVHYLQAIPDPEAPGAHEAAWALAGLGHADAIPLLRAHQDASALEAPWLAARALLEGLRDTLRALRKHANPETSPIQVWMLLGCAGDPEDVPRLAKAQAHAHQADPSSPTCHTLVAALATHGTPAAWSVLDALPDANDEETQAVLTYALRWLAGPDGEAPTGATHFRLGARFDPARSDLRSTLLAVLASDTPVAFRRLAALELRLHAGVCPLFDCQAPVWQQQARLAELGEL